MSSSEEEVGNFVLFYKALFSGLPFEKLLEEIEPFCRSYERMNSWTGRSYLTPRKSCILSSAGESFYESEGLGNYSFEVSPTIIGVKKFLEENFRFVAAESRSFDYCLVHIYRDGDDNIAWHNDKEALGTAVFSVSFGATRKFRFRRIGQTRGFLAEIPLESGDLCIMLPGCQQLFEHCVPKEKRIKGVRINLTFRQV